MSEDGPEGGGEGDGRERGREGRRGRRELEALPIGPDELGGGGSSAEQQLFDLIEHAQIVPRSLCTRETVETLCELLREGHFVETAVAFAGVSQRAYHKWIGQGKAEIERLELELERLEGEARDRAGEGGGPVDVSALEARVQVDPRFISHVVLVQESARARAHAHVMALRRIKAAAQGNQPERADKLARADQWFLERSAPQLWGGKSGGVDDLAEGVVLELEIPRPLGERDADDLDDEIEQLEEKARVMARRADEALAAAVAEGEGDGQRW